MGFLLSFNSPIIWKSFIKLIWNDWRRNYYKITHCGDMHVGMHRSHWSLLYSENNRTVENYSIVFIVLDIWCYFNEYIQANLEHGIICLW